MNADEGLTRIARIFANETERRAPALRDSIRNAQSWSSALRSVFICVHLWLITPATARRTARTTRRGAVLPVRKIS
jgi:hypothetical protein